MKKAYLIILVMISLVMVSCAKTTSTKELNKFSTWLESKLEDNDNIVSITTYSDLINVNTTNNQYSINVYFDIDNHKMTYKTTSEELSILCKEYQNRYNR